MSVICPGLKLGELEAEYVLGRMGESMLRKTDKDREKLGRISKASSRGSV